MAESHGPTNLGNSVRLMNDKSHCEALLTNEVTMGSKMESEWCYFYVVFLYMIALLAIAPLCF